MFKPKLLRQEQGFTLVEVLVSILIATVFVATALQAMVVASLFKARARQYAEATTWIQEDLESVKERASQLQKNTALTVAANAATTVLTVESVNWFTVGDTLKVGDDSTSNVIASIETVPKTLTLTSALGTAQLNSATVGATTKCNAASQNTGFADLLRKNLPHVVDRNPLRSPTPPPTPVINTDIGDITGNPYILTRYGPDAGSTTPNVNNTYFEVMQVKYEVKLQGGSVPIATLFTEVIPDAAFQCP